MAPERAGVGSTRLGSTSKPRLLRECCSLSFLASGDAAIEVRRRLGFTGVYCESPRVTERGEVGGLVALDRGGEGGIGAIGYLNRDGEPRSAPYVSR